MALEKKYKNQLISIIHKHLPKTKIYLFGSRATNTESPGSDIDIAIDSGKPVDFSTKMKILIEIDETTVPMKVDLVDFNSVENNLKNDIEKKGILWTKN